MPCFAQCGRLNHDGRSDVNRSSNLLHHWFELFALSLLACFLCGFMGLHVFAQGKQAIVVMRAEGAVAVSACDGSAEPHYQTLYDLKLNNKDEVRLLSGIVEWSSTPTGVSRPDRGISRDEYDHARKIKIRDLVELEWNRSGYFFAISVAGQQPVLAIPDDSKPEKNSTLGFDAIGQMMVTGESREAGQKRKVSFPLREVWKIYSMPEKTPADESLFRHATEEKSVVLWDAVLRRTNGYRASDGKALLRDALIGCSQTELDRFASGEYPAIERARQKAERAQSIGKDDASDKLIAGIRQAKDGVDSTRGRVDQLIRSSQWDAAIETAAPVKKYLQSWPDLREMYDHTLKQSHEQHLFKGTEALKTAQLEAAESECTTAWKRLPDSKSALDCVCEARNELALRSSQGFRGKKEPKQAKELLERKLRDTDCPKDQRVLGELQLANCEYAQQLLAQASALITVSAKAPASPPVRKLKPLPRRRPGEYELVSSQRPQRRRTPPPATSAEPTPPPAIHLKALTVSNKSEFREAREKLILARDLCPGDSVQALLEAANSSLSEYCVAEARKALQRGQAGTAYVYLLTAQGYTPNDGSVQGLLNQAREQFELRTRVNVGVVLKNQTRSGADALLNDIAAEVESAATQAGLAKPVVLNRSDASRALSAIQAGRQLPSPTAIFFGDLLMAEVRKQDSPRSVQSAYSYDNPRWQEADRSVNEAKRSYNQCKKTSGEERCIGWKQEVQRREAMRNSYSRVLQQPYSFRENTITVRGGLKLAFRFAESISRSVPAADTLEDSVGEQCVQRQNVHPADVNMARDSICNVPDDGTYMGRMLSKVKREAQSTALRSLRELPMKYYGRAVIGASKQQAVEDYLCFVFLTAEKDSSQARQARRAALEFDSELSTDGVMR